MGIKEVKDYFKAIGREEDILEFETSSATVSLAAEALGVLPARIAKTISVKSDDGAILIVAAGDTKLNNSKFKIEFSFKPKMLKYEDVSEIIGHPVGGVCPFAINEGVKVYLDVSLKRFETIFPACGSGNSAIELTCNELDKYSYNQKWVDVCKGWEEENQVG